jgi:hypothetical protein
VDPSVRAFTCPASFGLKLGKAPERSARLGSRTPAATSFEVAQEQHHHQQADHDQRRRVGDQQ